MKKIVVMSDNHGRWHHPAVLKELESDADYYVHCGDNQGSDDDVNGYIAVRGNSDIVCKLPWEERFTCEGLEIGIIHGNQFGYRLSEETLFEYMDIMEYDLLFFGHIHRPVFRQENGKTIINPGSTAKSRSGPESYAVVYIENKEVKVEFKEF